MAQLTVHQSKVVKEYEEKTESEKLIILNNAFDILQHKPYLTKQKCICIAMGYKLYSCSDKTWYKE